MSTNELILKNNDIPLAKIIGIQYSLLSDEEKLRSSVAKIYVREMYKENKPVTNSLADIRMGTQDPGIICPTDNLDYINTPGYNGHIELARPVFYIQYLDDIKHWLHCVCFKCSKLLISKTKHKYLLNESSEKRWGLIVKECEKIKRCGEDTEDGCGYLKPTNIKKEGFATIIFEWNTKSNNNTEKETYSIKITPEIAHSIFRRISNEDVDFAGFNHVFSRPESMICYIYLVPPPAIRPSVKHDSQQRSEDDLTHILLNIIKTNNTLLDKIKENADANIIEEWTLVLQYYIASLVDNKLSRVASVSNRSSRPLKSIKDRINGKTGRMRGNLMAKRVDFSARSVITGEPNLSIEEVGVPLSIAKNITKPVIVNSRNKNFLLELVRNGPDIYPGAKILKRKDSERPMTLRYIDRESIELNNGDVVHRHLMNGDYFLFNRQPTLHRMSMQGVRARIMPIGNTFRFNVGIAKPFNADYDGDEMNMHMPQNILAEIELRELAAVPYQIISPANNGPIIGPVQDNLLGAYLFTDTSVSFDVRTAMNLLMSIKEININEFKNCIKEGRVTNFDILSQIIPPLSLFYKTKAFDNEDIKKSNNVLEIKNGKYIRGKMDKGVLSGGSKSLIQRIVNDFGNMRCVRFINDIQNIVTEFMKFNSFSVGISDLISNTKTKDEIVKIIDNKQNEVKDIIDQVMLGTFVNNTGRTNKDEFESQVVTILSQASGDAGKEALKSLDKNNRFIALVKSGSKGNENNIAFMTSCLGQQTVEGKRIPDGFNGRTLPHFTKYNNSPVARGFIVNSYVTGLNPTDLFFHAMAGRVGLIDTAVKSVTWETPIIIIENGQTTYTEIGRWIDNKLDNNIEKDKIQHFAERNMELLSTENKGIYIPTTDEKGKVTWGEIVAITRHDPGTELYEIKTQGGRKVTVTESKSLLVWDETLKEFHEKPTPEIKIGNFVPVTMNLPEPPSIQKYIDMSNYISKNEYVYGTEFNKAVEMINNYMMNRKKMENRWWDKNNNINFILPYNSKALFQRSLTRSNINIIKNGYIYSYHAARRNMFIPDKFELNEENGIFIGIYLAEGNSYKSYVNITNNNENIKTFVKKWFDTHSIKWVETNKINNIGGITNTISGKSIILSRFLIKLVGHLAENKHVPIETFNAPTEFIIGLLNGYFSGDGSISKNSIDVSSASQKLIENIAFLCNRLNIFAKVFKTQLKKNNLGTKNIKPSYRLSIRSKWGKIFSEKINLLDETKNIKINNINFTQTHINFESYNDVVLDKIVEINIIGVEKHPKVYDLTIPTTFNFGLANGLQVRDTSSTGYIQRRLVKGLEDCMVHYDHTIRSNKKKIIQFSYGDDNINTIKIETQSMPLVKMSTKEIYDYYNFPNISTDKSSNKLLSTIFTKDVMTLYKKQLPQLLEITLKQTEKAIEYRDDIIKHVFGYTDNNMVHCPVAFSYIIGNIQGQININSHSLVDITPLDVFAMIDKTMYDLEQIHTAPPTELFKALYYYQLTPKELLLVKRFNKTAIVLLLETIKINYKKSIVPPGEMVGPVAAQSIGELSTQMSCSYSTRIILLRREKSTQKIEIQCELIGKMCDNLIEENPHLTKNTGHPNSVETLLESLDYEYYVVGVDKNEKTHWNKISHISRHPVNGKMMRIKTKSGRSVETTTSHSHLVRSAEKQEVVPIVGANMKEGMRIPVAKYIENAFIQDHIWVGDKRVELNHLFGWFVGMYLINGNIDICSNYDICIITKSLNNVLKLNEFVKTFDETIIINTNKRQELYISIFNWRELANILIKMAGNIVCTYDDISIKKNVPSFAFIAPNEFKSALLQAYFNGLYEFIEYNKCLKNETNIYAIGKSKQLISDIALLLNYFNIFTCIKEESKTSCYARNKYVLNIPPKYISQYKKKISDVLYDRKLKDINEDIQYDLDMDLDPDMINGVHTIIKNCILKLKLYDLDFTSKIKNNDICRSLLEKYYKIFSEHKDAEVIKDELVILKQALEANVVWDEIVNIEFYDPENPEEYVYDFTVPGNQTFMVNDGVIVHNTLNTFHSIGILSKTNATRGVPRIDEILSLSKNIKNPSLTIQLHREDQENKERAQEIMYKLEHTILGELVKNIGTFFDPDDLNTLIEEDKPLITQYKEFENMINQCAGFDILNDTNAKSKWVVRMEMDPEIMLEKNITMDDIHFTLNNVYKNQISCVYSDYNSDKLIFRIRMTEVIKNNSSKTTLNKMPLDQTDQIFIINNFCENLLQNVVIRGVKNIKKVMLRKVKNTLIEKNGSYIPQDKWVLDTVGSNILDILALDYIDKYKVASNDIMETYSVLGIEAARQIIYDELVEVIGFDGTYIDHHHIALLCDRMTYSYKPISINRHGINNDDIGPIAKASFEETPQMLMDAAKHGELDLVTGVSANVMCGQEGMYGTNSFEILLDMKEFRNIKATEHKMIDKEKEIDSFFEKEDSENKETDCSMKNIKIENNIVNIPYVELAEDNDDYQLF